MRKIKLLYQFIILLIILNIISFLTNIYLSIYPPSSMDFPDEIYEKFIFGYYTQFVGLAISIVTFFGLIFSSIGLKSTINSGYFNLLSAKNFKIAGIILVTSGFLSLIFNLIIFFHSKGQTMFGELGQDFLLLLIGFSLIIIADFINKGNQIQLENDLTI